MRRAETVMGGQMEAGPPQTLAQPMEGRQLLKRLAAPTPAACLASEARLLQTPAQPMEARQLLKRPVAPAVPSVLFSLDRQAQPRPLLPCWAAPQTRPQQRRAARPFQTQTQSPPP